jgi:hypothetical protein
MGAGKRSVPIAGATPPYSGNQARTPEDAFPSRNASQGPGRPSRDVRAPLDRKGLNIGPRRSF